MTAWQTVLLSDVMRLDVNTVVVDPSAEYPVVGVLNRGRGLLYRDPMPGSDTKYKSLNRIGPGQVVYSRLKAFEGAITVAPADISEAYASQEFPTFTCDGDLLPAYFALLTTTAGLWADLQNLSTGMGGRRERVKPADFLTLRLDLPPRDEQSRIVNLMGAVDEHVEAMAEEVHRLWAALTVARRALLEDAPATPLGDLCAITARLVDPLSEGNADLPHVGVEVIEKNTGRILGARTAREDAVTSGKYKFSPGDVLYSKIRPGLRKVAVAECAGLCSADAYPLTPRPGVPATLLREALLHEPVVERIVQMSGRTKMPKVNRSELFSVEVPMPDEGTTRASVDATLHGLRNQAESLSDEVASLRAFRATLLAGLLSQSISIPSTYDALLRAAS